MRRRAALAFSSAAAALALGGCAAWLPPPQTRALTAAAPAGLPGAVELERVPFFPQTPYHCGPAALATALVDAGLAVTPEALADAVFLPAREGSLQAEMLAGARRQGTLAWRLPGTLEALLATVAAGQPVVVLQNLGLAIAPRWHYAVVVGYDLPQRTIVLRSGTTRREILPLATFEHTWARGGHWAFVALPPGQLPPRTDVETAVQASVAFERVAAPAQAARAYETLLARWPEPLLAWLGLGNARLAAGDADAAATAYGEAARRHDSAVAWNNLAQALARLGRRTEALDAARRAVARAETAEPVWVDATRQTLRELEAEARP